MAKLSELGEDVLIGVRAKVKAKLTRAGVDGQDRARARWIRELTAVQKAYSTGRTKTSLEAILANLRQDRG